MRLKSTFRWRIARFIPLNNLYSSILRQLTTSDHVGFSITNKSLRFPEVSRSMTVPPPIRLLVLPVTSKRWLLYCQKTSVVMARKTPSLEDKLVKRAQDMWKSWEKADRGYKKTIVNWGNKLFERIPYEEWSLRTIPSKSAILRTVANLSTVSEEEHVHRVNDKIAVTHAEIQQKKLTNEDIDNISTVYPARMFQEHVLETQLADFAQKSMDSHKKTMMMCLVGIPLTLPIALIPVVPNLPCFYLMYRAWCNWKAMQGAAHLDYLVTEKHLSFTPSEDLTSLYESSQDKSILAAVKRIEAGDGEGKEGSVEEIVLDDSLIDDIAVQSGAEELQTELHRALRQAKKRVEGQ